MLHRPFLAVALLLACSRAPGPAPEATPEPAAEQAVDAPQLPPAPPPPPPGPAPVATLVREATALQPGDTATALAPDARTVVDPSSTFRVVLASASQDARLALHDAGDAAIPSTATVEVGETTVLTLAPAAPLVPGGRYQLRLDGAVTRELHVGDRAFTPALYALQASGDPPRSPPPRKRSRR